MFESIVWESGDHLFSISVLTRKIWFDQVFASNVWIGDTQMGFMPYRKQIFHNMFLTTALVQIVCEMYHFSYVVSPNGINYILQSTS